MSSTFFNTTNEVNPQLALWREAAGKQDILVLDFFRRHPGMLFSPSEIWSRTGLEAKSVPLTSVRRAMTNLTDSGYLVKTSTKQNGIYGRPESCWIYPHGLQAA